MTSTVLHVVGSLAAGGNERAALQLASGLESHGFRNVVVPLTSQRDGFSEKFPQAGLPVHPCMMEPDRPLDFVSRFRRLCQSSGATSVLSYSFSRAHLWIHYAARRAGVPVRLTRVSGWPLVEPRRRGNRRLQRWSRWVCTREVANSDAVRGALIDLGGFPAKRIRAVRNGIDARHLKAVVDQGRVPADADLRVLMTARLEDAKDHLTLLRAFAHVHRKIPQANLTLVGDGPLRPALAAEANRLHLAGPVEFAGAQPEAVSYLASAETFVLSTRHEGSPNALLEAMAAGRACIATDVPPVRELLNGAGILVPPGDPTALGNAILRCLEDQRLRGMLGQAAHHRALNEYPLERTLHLYADLLRRQ